MGSETRVGRWGSSGGNAHLWYCRCMREHAEYVKSCHECGTLRPAPNTPESPDSSSGWRARVEALRKGMPNPTSPAFDRFAAYNDALDDVLDVLESPARTTTNRERE